jgi:hypothetical protein
MIVTRAKSRDNDPSLPIENYYVFALGICKNFPAAVCVSESKELIAALGMAWYRNDDLLNHDKMEWQTALQVLKRVGKVDHDSWGKMREDGERQRLKTSLPIPAAGMVFMEDTEEWRREFERWLNV